MHKNSPILTGKDGVRDRGFFPHFYINLLKPEFNNVNLLLYKCYLKFLKIQISSTKGWQKIQTHYILVFKTMI